MKNLHEYEVNLKTGELTARVIKDVMITRKKFVVRRRFREFDIEQGKFTLLDNLDQVFVRRENCVYASTLNPNPILFHKLKEESIKYINIQIDFARQRLRGYEGIKKEIISNMEVLK